MIRFRLKERIADLEFEQRRKVTLSEIAEATGLNRTTLSKLSSSSGYNTTTDVLDRLCAYFGCKIGDIVEYVPEDRDRGSGAK